MLRVLPVAWGAAPLRAFGLCAALAACAAPPPPPAAEQVIGGVPASQIVPGYGLVEDGDYTLPPVPPAYLRGVNRRALVAYNGEAAPGTIEIDPFAKFLYWIQPDGTAWRYPIAVGREGLGISGTFTIQRKAEWPGWTPTANMLRREPEIYGPFRNGVPGGLSSPLGARGLYLYRGGRDTYYRIHGTNDLSSIGNSGSAGCIRLFNQDVIDLFDLVPMGTTVTIRTYEDSVRIEGEAMAERGIELPPFYLTPEELYDGVSTQRPPVPEAMLPESLYRAPVLLDPFGGVDRLAAFSASHPSQGAASLSPGYEPAVPATAAAAAVEMTGAGFTAVQG